LFENADFSERARRVGNRDDAIEIFQISDGAAFKPNVHLVAAAGNIRNGDAAGAIRQTEVRRIHSDDDAAHLLVNIAKKKANAGAIEANRFARTGLVESKIKTFAIEKRKDVVKERIFVGEANLGTDLNDENVW